MPTVPNSPYSLPDRHHACHRPATHAEFAYVANGGRLGNPDDDSVSGYAIDPSTGALTAIPGSPFAAGPDPTSVAVDPSGKFAYVANSGSNNVSGYTINPSTGALTTIVGLPFAPGTDPASMTVDPSGKFVYVANGDFSNNVTGYTIDPSTGALTASHLHSVAAMSILEVTNMVRKADGNPERVEMNMNMFGALIRGKNVPGNPEGWFWRVGIEDGIRKLYPKYSDSLRIGLTVDSNLDSLDRYNSRDLPIHEEYFLPKNFTLIYASTDSGSDYVLNQLIKLCDREAELQLDSIERGVLSNEVFTKLSGHKHTKIPGTPFRFYDE